jgi:hypothetical protein
VRTPTGGHAATVIAWQTLEPLATGRAQDCVGTAEAGESVTFPLTPSPEDDH